MEMEAKLKAYDIFNKCCDYADYTDEDGCFTERETMYKNAKALSLIFINEILKDRERLSDALFYDLNYWVDVKKHIEEIEICENDVFKLPKKYTEKHLKYAYEQGAKVDNQNYYRSFENVLNIINSSTENDS